jgi:hypothetical protein
MVHGSGIAMKLDYLTFQGPPIDDEETLRLAPASLQRILNQVNGFIQFGGGLHVRGACHEPHWHSLRRAWQGDDAIHRRYSALLVEDVPFGQDCVGDQYLLRQDSVIKLAAETGDIEELKMPIMEFLEAVQRDPIGVLGLAPLLKFHQQGRTLLPGQLLNVYPPFCTKESSNGVSLAAIPVAERLAFLADLSKQLETVADGEQIVIDV